MSAEKLTKIRTRDVGIQQVVTLWRAEFEWLIDRGDESFRLEDELHRTEGDLGVALREASKAREEVQMNSEMLRVIARRAHAFRAALELIVHLANQGETADLLRSKAVEALRGETQ